jgi:hypothetical protein
MTFEQLMLSFLAACVALAIVRIILDHWCN